MNILQWSFIVSILVSSIAGNLYLYCESKRQKQEHNNVLKSIREELEQCYLEISDKEEIIREEVERRL